MTVILFINQTTQSIFGYAELATTPWARLVEERVPPMFTISHCVYYWALLLLFVNPQVESSAVVGYGGDDQICRSRVFRVWEHSWTDLLGFGTLVI